MNYYWIYKFLPDLIGADYVAEKFSETEAKEYITDQGGNPLNYYYVVFPFSAVP